MDTEVPGSISMPSLRSLTAKGNSAECPTPDSSHIIAYLRQDSAISDISCMGDENATTRQRQTPILPESRVSHDSLWRSLTQEQPDRSPLRCLQNMAPSFSESDRSGPTLPTLLLASGKRRPPPLQLRTFGPSLESPILLTDEDKTPIASNLVTCKGSLMDLSPWQLLDEFPSPPLDALRLAASLSVSRIFRSGRNISARVMDKKPQTRSKGCGGEQDENTVPTPKPVQVRNHTKSFGSFGRSVRPWDAISAPSSPAPPLPERRGRSNSASVNDFVATGILASAHRRDASITSRLFTLASPKPEQRSPPRPKISSHYIPHHQFRTANYRTDGLGSPNRGVTPALSRSRSIHLLGTSKAKERRLQSKTTGIDAPVLPLDIPKPLVIPPRTRSQSYIDLQVQPRRQTNTSPTQTSFVTVGTLFSAPNTPTSSAFEPLDEVMYLPSSGSTESVRAGVDPFGAGEPASFFRFEFSQKDGVIERKGEPRERLNSWEPNEASNQLQGNQHIQPSQAFTPPEIIVVSSSVAIFRHVTN